MSDFCFSYSVTESALDVMRKEDVSRIFTPMIISFSFSSFQLYQYKKYDEYAVNHLSKIWTNNSSRRGARFMCFGCFYDLTFCCLWKDDEWKWRKNICEFVIFVLLCSIWWKTDLNVFDKDGNFYGQRISLKKTKMWYNPKQIVKKIWNLTKAKAKILRILKIWLKQKTESQEYWKSDLSQS